MRLRRGVRSTRHGSVGRARARPVTYRRCDAAAIVETIGVYPLVVVWPDLAGPQWPVRALAVWRDAVLKALAETNQHSPRLSIAFADATR